MVAGGTDFMLLRELAMTHRIQTEPVVESG
jgi:hypothetical protein